MQHCALTSEVAVGSAALVCSPKGLVPFLRYTAEVLYRADVLVFTLCGGVEAPAAQR